MSRTRIYILKLESQNSDHGQTPAGPLWILNDLPMLLYVNIKFTQAIYSSLSLKADEEKVRESFRSIFILLSHKSILASKSI